MRKIIKILFITLLIFSCQNSSKNKNNETTTLVDEITSAIQNTTWVNINSELNYKATIDLSESRFKIGVSNAEGGPELLNFEGSWHIEGNNIKFKYDNGTSIEKHTINNDFSTITGKNGAIYNIDKTKKEINLNLNELYAKYNYSPKQKEKEKIPQEILNEIISYTGDFTGGISEIGYIEGTSDIYIDQDHLKVDYSAMGQHISESGYLKNVKLNRGQNGSDAITGLWIRSEGGTGDFHLAIDDTKENSVICIVYNEGGKWAYYKSKEVHPDKFIQIAKLLNYNYEEIFFNNELKSIIENTVWETKPTEFGVVFSIQFLKSDFAIQTKTSRKSQPGSWVDNGFWSIEEDYIIKNKAHAYDEDDFWIISDDFTKIVNRYGEEYYLIKDFKDLNSLRLDELRNKFNYKTHFSSYAYKTKYQPSSDPKNYFDLNSFVVATTNYKVQVKNEIESLDVIQGRTESYGVWDTTSIAKINHPETYTVMNVRNRGFSEEERFLLSNELKLKEINSNQYYTILPDQMITLTDIDYDKNTYLATVEVNNNKLKFEIPIKYISPVYEDSWLYLKELNGWVQRDKVQFVNSKSIDEIKVKKNTDGTVTIVNQTWANKDLDVSHYNNGDPIFEAKTIKHWVEANFNKQGCFYRHENGTVLYNGYAVKDRRGIIPEGFSLPSADDFNTLFFNLGGINKAEELLATYESLIPGEDYINHGLIDIKKSGINSVGFNAKPSGHIYFTGEIDNGHCNIWWTSSKTSKENYVVMKIGYCGEFDSGEEYPLSFGFAIRPIKNTYSNDSAEVESIEDADISMSKQKENSEKEELKSNQTKELSDEFLGNYHGIQQSYYMMNEYGDEMIIAGNKVRVPSSDFKFLLKKDNFANLQQTNLEDNQRHYYDGSYIIKDDETDLIKIEVSLSDGQGSSPTYILEINKSTKTGNCIGNISENGPVFNILKIN